MGKTYIDTVKYLIKGNFDIDGQVEKPDIVGAIFGQTEGLLGDELDLRELQKNGRIGRIEVNAQMKGGRSIGNILIPSSLDMVETSILAASIEIVDRVGPYEAKMLVEKIEDTRNLKRKMLLDRAKMLLKTVVADEIPESKELAELVRAEVKVAEVQSYGPDKLPAGPGVASSDSVIIVEGRADVLNMLRNGIKNVVSIGGANVGKTIIDLAKEKEATVFLDGDRGGDMILKDLMSSTEIDFVARAPTGKEVEELTRKELVMCLRRKIPAEQAMNELNSSSPYTNGGDRQEFRSRRVARTGGAVSSPAREYAPSSSSPSARDSAPQPYARRVMPSESSSDSGSSQQQSSQRFSEPADAFASSAPAPQQPKEEPLSAEENAKVEMLRQSLKELEGSLKAKFFDNSGSALGEVPIRDIMRVLGETDGVAAVVLDGIITQRLVDLADQKRVRFLVGLRPGNITRKPASVIAVFAQQ